MTALPLSVIGGYLGAGKTTLINRILAADHGQRLMVLVNDFGAINIDAALLLSASEDTIALTNGCVCCTMGADLFMAIGDVLDREALPDHLIVEASGIANPARIANVAQAEPDLRYGGILTVVDGAAFPTLVADRQIGPQLAEQVRVADLVAVSKTPAGDGDVEAALKRLGIAEALSADDLGTILHLLLRPPSAREMPSDAPQTHPDYVQWSCARIEPMTREEIRRRLARRPEGIFRLKGLIPDRTGGTWEVHVVGTATEILHHASTTPSGLVAIGLRGAVSPEEIDAWWQEQR